MCGASSVESLDALQERLGYRFRDTGLLLTALTHSSYANEHRQESNERLEFVGDSVLGMIVAGSLFRRYPEMPEGRMTRLRAELVCEQSLWEVSEQLGLGQWLRLGKGEELTGGRERPSILADCVEAVLAAMYLDGGMAPPLALIDRFILSRLGKDGVLEPQDSKTRLQELVQRRPGRSIVYTLTGESGPDHDKRFTVTVSVDGEAVGSGEGRTKKEAEQLAARSALRRLE